MKFDTMRNGYNRFQVDDEFNKATERIESLERQVAAFEKQSILEKKQLQEALTKYNELKSSLDIKEKAAKEMTAIALSEANVIVSNANENAEAIVKEALLSARNILLNISKLGIEAQEIKANLNEQLKILADAIDGFDVPPIPDADLLNNYDD